MAKILVMTDLHITPEGQTIIGLDPGARLEAGLAHAGKAHPDADRLVLMGDLTHHGTAEEYARLKSALSDLPWPVTLMIGNHDTRAGFLACFPEAPTDTNCFVQSCVELDDVRLICLDTHQTDPDVEHSGTLCPARLTWLEEALSNSEKPCLVFLHHPPFDTGFTGMDRIGLTNAPDLRRVLTRHAQVAHVFAGHIHRTITASIGGLPITVFKSPCHQMPMILGEEGSGHSVDEPGAYGIILTQGDSVVVHFEDFTLPEQDVDHY
ncbi:phosphodiesterase [Nioella aestuarii]|uniref:phosphodiesterase n=1 Tax=Nioella aestuarii TaxID=1662864 RepID=UPI003D7F4A36